MRRRDKNLGNALRSLGRIDEALVQYQKAVGAMPDYAEARNNLACGLSAEGRLERGAAALQ